MADQYERLLDDLLVAMRTAHCDTPDGIVRVRFDWAAPGFLVSAATDIETLPAQQADWLASARIVDEGNHRGLLNGLLDYAKAQNPPRFPQAAASGVMMLRPETRLSWIAELLPYLGHRELARRVGQRLEQRRQPAGHEAAAARRGQPGLRAGQVARRLSRDALRRPGRRGRRRRAVAGR